jgi:16S rRNA A1518/A1519 N6-dimethyltransferase RsmA/KsgA/DIM1 with predicted DNA glycosylase/AP lyase activity
MNTLELGANVTNKINQLLKQIQQEELYTSCPKGLELELRFQPKMPNWEEWWAKLKKRLDFQAPHKEQQEDKVFIKQHSNVDYRKISSSNALTIYEKKYKQKFDSVMFEIMSGYNNNKKTLAQFTSECIQPVKLAAAIETEISQSGYDLIPATHTTVRSRKRFSYFYPKLSATVREYMIRVDLTYVLSNNSEEYQLELEVLNLKLDTKYILLALLKGLSAIYTNMHTIFTTESYAHYSALKPLRGQAPINIQTEHINQGIQNMFYVTNKLDGVAYSLFIYNLSATKLVLVLKNDTDCWIVNKIDTNENSVYESIFEHMGSEFKCEVVIRPPQIQIHLFDVLSYRHKSPPGSFTSKIQILNTVKPFIEMMLKPQFKIFVKQFFKTPSFRQDITDCVQFMNKEQPVQHQMVQNNDGLIFQPEDTSKDPLKWKFFSKISIDFLFLKQPPNPQQPSTVTYYSLNTMSNTQHQPEKFKFPMSGKPAFIAFENSSRFEGYSCSDLHNLIIECGWNNKQFYIMKIRWDKFYANSTHTAVKTFYDMIHERTLPMLCQQVEIAASKSPRYSSSLQSSPMLKMPTTPTLYEDNTPSVLIKQMSDKDRTQLFPDADCVFDQWITNKGVTKPSEAAEISKRILGFVPSLKTIVNMSAGVGGNTLDFGKRGWNVIAVEKDPVVFEALEHNVKQYQMLYSEAKFVLVNLSVTQAVPKLLQMTQNQPIDVIYFDVIGEEQSSVILECMGIASIVVLRCKPQVKINELTSRLEASHEYECKKFNLSYCWLVFVFKSGFGFRGMRQKNNALKAHLIHKYAMNKHVLDLGTGKGGDLHKYRESKIKSLFCVEPLKDHIEELKKRIKDSSFHNSQIRVLQECAEELNLSETFDVVNMFFSLTFFFRSEALLDKLLTVVDTHLNDKGVFMGMVMIGTKIKMLLQSLPNQTYDSPHLFLKQTFKSNDLFGNQIEIELKETQTATLQSEFLVDFNVLFQKLATLGLYLSVIETIDYSSLTADERLIAENNVAFVCKRNVIENAHSYPIPLGFTCGYTNAWRIPSGTHQQTSLLMFYHMFNALHHDKDLQFLEFIFDFEKYSPNTTLSDETQHVIKRFFTDLANKIDISLFISILYQYFPFPTEDREQIVSLYLEVKKDLSECLRVNSLVLELMAHATNVPIRVWNVESKEWEHHGTSAFSHSSNFALFLAYIADTNTYEMIQFVHS